MKITKTQAFVGTCAILLVGYINGKSDPIPDSKVQAAPIVAPAIAPTPAKQPTIKPNPQPAPTPTPTPTPTPVYVPQPAPQPVYNPPAVYYQNCTEARAAGVTPIYAGEPGYASKLDRDNDGIACE